MDAMTVQGRLWTMVMVSCFALAMGCGELGSDANGDPENFVGTYQGSTTISGNGSQTFTTDIVVTEGTTADLLVSFSDVRNVRATIQGPSSFSFESQSLTLTDENGSAFSVTLLGSGTVVDNIINLNTTLSSANGTFTVTANGTRL